MNRPRTLAPLLALNRKHLKRAAGLTALAAMLFPVAPARAHTTYTVTVTDLTHASSAEARAWGVFGDTQVGDSNDKATIWTGTAASAVSLAPAGSTYSEIYGMDGSTQAGFGENFDARGNRIDHAFLWNGTAASAVDLNPAGYANSQATAVSGDTQVGYGETGNSNPHALLWTGTPGSVVDLNPAGYQSSEAVTVSGDTQGGYAGNTVPDGDYYTFVSHALLWHGTPDSAVDLHPKGFKSSGIEGIQGDTQVGYGYTAATNSDLRPLLWHGTPGSVRDLMPSGFSEGVATATSGGAQAGYANAPSTDSETALLWTGTAQSAINLGKFLPSSFRIESEARGVRVNGNEVDVVGIGYDSNNFHAFLWRVTFPAQPTLLQLDPATRTAGRGAFTLAVHGTGFTSKSVITWNGAAQPTTLVSPFEVCTTIPASLTASTGTAAVLVATPGYANTLSRIETVHS